MTTESPRWFKSSYSQNGGQCAEVATNLVVVDGSVAVRDSKDPAGPALTFTSEAWTAFVAGIRSGDFSGI
ncbi:DUF397 domain-containing protein [Actinacidiphila paucisporea]|uniref:DUF397 domain-containing protein n=1 Tax=Actinacidiphila paucisporea TaxID=310782 RepID=A0A1M6Z5P7_9ACTN|nr:DUF397 domain-containing protein [Actinacidiphila paucisporea]SHL25794.1 protein of unknown function [Actinacidiphila paucisporea]